MYIIFKKFHLKDKNILYISCDASNTDKIAQIYCSSVLGFTNENIYSIENGIPTIIPDYVLLYGKNSFELLAFLKERKLFDYIKHIVNNGCTYIGFGAGAALVGNDIATINYCYSNNGNFPNATDLSMLISPPNSSITDIICDIGLLLSSIAVPI